MLKDTGPSTWQNTYIRVLVDEDHTAIALECDMCLGQGPTLEAIQHTEELCPIGLLTQAEIALKKTAYAAWFQANCISWVNDTRRVWWQDAIQAAEDIVGKFNPQEDHA